MRRAREDGFTLVETLIALAIAGLSFAVLYKIISDDLDRTRRVRDEATAAALAQSLLARAQADDRPAASSGRAAGGFAWRVAVDPHRGIGAGWPVDAVDVVATVSWREGTTPQSRTLSTLRIVPKARAQ